MAHHVKNGVKKPKKHATLRTKVRWVRNRDMHMNGLRRWMKWFPSTRKEVPPFA